MKTPENRNPKVRFSDVFWGYEIRAMDKNGVKFNLSATDPLFTHFSQLINLHI